MASLQQLAAGRKDLYLVDPGLIQEDEGWNVRTETPELMEHIRGLADSIKINGVRQPLTVYMRGDTPILTDGHCRLKAVAMAIAEGAEIKTVPVRCEERTANDADRTLSLLIRNSGKPLTGLEQATVIKRLTVFGWSDKDIAARTGYSDRHIANLAILSGAPAKVQSMVAEGKVAATLAISTLKEQGEDGAVQALEKAVEVAKEKGKDRATKKHVEKPPETPKPAKVPSKQGIDWSVVGPELEEAVTRLLRVVKTCTDIGPFNDANVLLAKLKTLRGE
jgi:ParB-like chromosome segregation protein Spo0J